MREVPVKTGEYAKDAGSEITFIPVESVGINNPSMDTDNDPVVYSSYYTLQGIKLGSQLPVTGGIYIEKNTHKSNKVSARKIYVPQK
ncbi:MAG: hypothetical protein LIO93_01515 [Bacteroidales bacterium]|nr:hypothetical protein [Bacteroidales bacterium]